MRPYIFIAEWTDYERQRSFHQSIPACFSDLTSTGKDLVRPESVIAQSGGTIYVANIASSAIQKLDPSTCQAQDFLTEVDGVRLTCPNFVFLDSKNRLWMSFSTRESIWWPAAAHPRPDGFIVLFDENGARIVADGIYFTNEVRLDANEEYLSISARSP